MPCCLRADRWARADLTLLKRLCSEDSFAVGYLYFNTWMAMRGPVPNTWRKGAMTWVHPAIFCLATL